MTDVAFDKLNDVFRSMLDYDKVKDRIYVRIQKDCDMGDVLKTTILDWAVTYHILMGDPEDKMLLSCQVTKDLFDGFGVSLEQLHKDSLLNSQRLFPASCERILDVLMPGAGDDFNNQFSAADGFEMLVITNKSNTFGASAILYPGMLEKLRERLGNEFYILPSSVHEVLAVPAGRSDAECLAEMVRSINNTELDYDDRLSDHVYRYDAETMALEIAA